MDKIRKTIILILTFAGLILALELCKIYYDANFNQYALASFCSVNNLIDCDGVAKTSYSQFLGVPLSVWGVCFYLFVTLLVFAPKLSQFRLLRFLEVFKNPSSYIFCLAVISFIISMFLAGVQFFAINKICVLCFATYFIDLAIGLTAKDYKKPWYAEIIQSFEDFKAAISVKKYLIAFLAVVIAFAGILFYTNSSSVFTPQIKKEKNKFIGNKNFITHDNVIGDVKAKIVIHEYMDFNCASCFIMNLSLQRIMTELDGIMIIKHDMPLDSECNPMLEKGGHKGSCLMAKYALAAKRQNKYWEVSEKLFDQTPNTEEKILAELKQIKGLNMKKLQADANSDEVMQELKQEIDDGIKKEIEATPTIIINMQKITGNMPYYDLKEKLLQMGAKEKKQQ